MGWECPDYCCDQWADKDGKALKNVIIYNVKTGNSHMLPPMLHKRYGCMAVVIENTIVVVLEGADEKWNDLEIC